MGTATRAQRSQHTGGNGNKDLLLLASVLGSQDSVYVDGNARNAESFGQIVSIDFWMDVTIAASSFLEFFAASNSLLAKMADEDIEFFRSWMIG